jgi:hypothetical protein
MTQALEQIVRCSVLLHDHDNMLEGRDLSVSEQASKEQQQRSSKRHFHPDKVRNLQMLDDLTLYFVPSF